MLNSKCQWMVAVSSIALLFGACSSTQTTSTEGQAPAPTPSPTPSPSPSPSPTPSPTPTPSRSGFETSEYQASWALGEVEASAAYAAGASGQGITVAVIDSGIDIDHPDLIDNLHAGSRDINATRNDLNDLEGHGTGVAGLITASRNDVGMHGLAWEAQILAIKATDTDNCDAFGACSYRDEDLVAAVDYAIDQNASIINLSFGSGQNLADDQNSPLYAVLQRAADAGILLVMAEGNEDDPETNFPGHFAADASANGLAIAVGSLTQAGNIASFSNGSTASFPYFLVAPGAEVTTTWIGGATLDVDGTSFSTAIVSGALALMFDAFPNLSAADNLQVLIDTADDVVAGTQWDGSGLLNLEAAFSAQGFTSSSFQGGPKVSVNQLAKSQQGAFGNWITHSGVFNDIIIRDRYDRAFKTDIRPLGLETSGSRWLQSFSAQNKPLQWHISHGKQALSMRSSRLETSPAANQDLSQRDTAEFAYSRREGLVQFGFGRGSALVGNDAIALTQSSQSHGRSSAPSGLFAFQSEKDVWSTANYALNDIQLGFELRQSEDFETRAATIAINKFGNNAVSFGAFEKKIQHLTARLRRVLGSQAQLLKDDMWRFHINDK